MKTSRITKHPRPPKAVKLAPKPAIDYPKDGERLDPPAYTLRLSAPGARRMTVAIDQGTWQECRDAVGYWWFDWRPEGAGEHELIACAEYEGGREAVSEVIHCFSS
jgi:hypothetical protein